jgi:DNA-binding CsgD family transcriptional regulator
MARTIALLLGQGYRKSEIAGIMNISPQTVGYHVNRTRQVLAGALA